MSESQDRIDRREAMKRRGAAGLGGALNDHLRGWDAIVENWRAWARDVGVESVDAQ